MRWWNSKTGWRCLSLAVLVTSAQASTLEEAVARGFVRGYKRDEARLAEIRTELEQLPQPYLREPTGTGGFLSHALPQASDEVVVSFSFHEMRELDAVALFPLRLFMDEIYGDNLYWPEHITVETRTGGENRILAERHTTGSIVRQSLPELIEFTPVTTDQLTIRCSGLQQHPHERWFAAGFSEICVFSGPDNVAPRAEVTTSRSRQGYFVLALEYLTDGHTPLGLPELSDGPGSHDFVKRWMSRSSINAPYRVTINYPREIPIDSLRIDPAIEHAYGQGFPMRFTIELLDAVGEVVYTDKTYQEYPMRPPGLNPYFAHWPETNARSVRLTVLEIFRPGPQTPGSIAFSEITPLCNGVVPLRPTTIEEEFRGARMHSELGGPPDTNTMRALASASDGLTHSGRVLPLRQWIEGLVQRQRLLDERATLLAARQSTLTRVSGTLVYGSLSLLVLVAGSAVYLIVRNRIRLHRELLSTRARIASDLHDDVGSNLGTIILHVDDLREHSHTPRQQSKLDAIHRLTRESIFGLREVLTTTTPEVGRTQNIVAYMEELAGLILGTTEHTFHTAPAMSQSLLDHRLRKGILLFYKEALYNAKRHSECSHVDISLGRQGNRIVLSIKDDGKGIDAATRARPRNLRTLKKRAERLQAELDIQSEPGTGTQLTLAIPTG
ncbi:MAG: sensor histidine kinase [Verrucomicrobiales bacterium]|nr:histidine kinase [Verrucomicrobiota bacterium JB025]